MFLCDACTEARFPSTSADTAPAVNATLATAVSDIVADDDELDLNDAQMQLQLEKPTETLNDWIKSELLCFVSDKCNVMAVDQLVDICVKFYREDELMAARQIIYNAGVRIPKRQGGNKLTATTEDIVKAVLKPKAKLPQFFAANLSRLPPVDMKHCDTAAILIELQALRAEVRDFTKVQVEVSALRAETQRLRSDLSLLRAEFRDRSPDYDELPKLRSEHHAVQSEIRDLLISQSEMAAWRGDVQHSLSNISEQMGMLSGRQAVIESQSHSRSANTAVSTASTPREAGTSSAAAPSTSSVAAVTVAPTAASIVSAAVRTGALQQPAKRNPKFAVGTSQRSNLQSAKLLKPVNIFVSRLDPSTSCSDISTCIADTVKSALDLSIPPPNIQCDQLQTKFDSYASFSVCVMVEEAKKDNVIELLMSSEGWPKGVLVRKFYRNKRNG